MSSYATLVCGKSGTPSIVATVLAKRRDGWSVAKGYVDSLNCAAAKPPAALTADATLVDAAPRNVDGFVYKPVAKVAPTGQKKCTPGQLADMQAACARASNGCNTLLTAGRNGPDAGCFECLAPANPSVTGETFVTSWTGADGTRLEDPNIGCLNALQPGSGDKLDEARQCNKAACGHIEAPYANAACLAWADLSEAGKTGACSSHNAAWMATKVPDTVMSFCFQTPAEDKGTDFAPLRGRIANLFCGDGAGPGTATANPH